MTGRLSGDELRAWAREMLGKYVHSQQSLELLLIEVYLRGAVDALKEEVTFLRERGPGVRKQQ